ncbi:MAG: hypothetical protein HY537_15175 [Deltaproteobacteria bacterium]|nr:hypothetical protein [Deltaproteobacteria bacterium]
MKGLILILLYSCLRVVAEPSIHALKNPPTATVRESGRPQASVEIRRPAALHQQSITGVLADGGIECQRILGEDGKEYTVDNRKGLENLKIGDKVHIFFANIQPRSFCMQGNTISPLRIDKLEH